MNRDDIKPYLEFEVRRHRDGGWIWPARDDDGPGWWGLAFVFILALALWAIN